MVSPCVMTPFTKKTMHQMLDFPNHPFRKKQLQLVKTTVEMHDTTLVIKTPEENKDHFQLSRL